MFNVRIVLIILIFISARVQARVQSELQYFHMNFLSTDYENTEDQSFNFIGAHLKSYQSENDVFKINLDGAYAIKNSVLSYLDVKELYFSISVDETSQIHLGRRLHQWSLADQRWNLGLIQPQFRWNPLMPETQGLMGIFYEKRAGSWLLNLLGSPIFIPDQGPSYELKEGQFVNSNPYFRAPPQNIYFQDVLLPIDYNVITPQFSEVVMQPSFGMQVEYLGQDRQSVFGGISFTYKPSNQLALGYSGVLVTDRVRIDITPKTYYEKNIAFDLGYRFEEIELGLSTIYNDPDDINFESDTNAPLLKTNTTISPSISINTKPFYFVVAGYYNTLGQIEESGPEADPSRASLTQKFLFENGYIFEAYYKNLITQDIRLSTGLQWKEMDGGEFKQISSKNTVDLRGPWKFNLDILLVETAEKDSAYASFRNLDQLWAGVSYDF